MFFGMVSSASRLLPRFEIRNRTELTTSIAKQTYIQNHEAFW